MNTIIHLLGIMFLAALLGMLAGNFIYWLSDVLVALVNGVVGGLAERLDAYAERRRVAARAAERERQRKIYESRTRDH